LEGRHIGITDGRELKTNNNREINVYDTITPSKTT
jgi:hypothetical protein